MKRAIIYEGPSMLDGAPIVVIATATASNSKTGAVVQTYILTSSINPLEASKTGADKSICGDCPLRGAVTTDPAKKQAAGRACYVQLSKGPLVVWKAYKRGFYPVAQDIAAIGRGQIVRLGTYGDPAAVPVHVWRTLLSQSQGWTGYSHQSGFQPDLVMQSADNLDAAQGHWAKGARTFRVIRDLAELVADREILCPASKEAGYRTTCASCKLCAGTATRSAKSIAIVAHGNGAGFF